MGVGAGWPSHAALGSTAQGLGPAANLHRPKRRAHRHGTPAQDRPKEAPLLLGDASMGQASAASAQAAAATAAATARAYHLLACVSALGSGPAARSHSAGEPAETQQRNRTPGVPRAFCEGQHVLYDVLSTLIVILRQNSVTMREVGERKKRIKERKACQPHSGPPITWPFDLIKRETSWAT